MYLLFLDESYSDLDSSRELENEAFSVKEFNFIASSKHLRRECHTLHLIATTNFKDFIKYDDSASVKHKQEIKLCMRKTVQYVME